MGQTEYIVRGIGYVRTIADLSNIVVAAPGFDPISQVVTVLVGQSLEMIPQLSATTRTTTKTTRRRWPSRRPGPHSPHTGEPESPSNAQHSRA